MPSAYQKANAANQAEIKRLAQLIVNLEALDALGENSNSWNAIWPPSAGPRLRALKVARNANPTNYTNNKLKKKLANLENKIMVRRWMYGYVPKVGANWVSKAGLRVPRHLPESEVKNFRRFTKAGIPFTLAYISKAGPLRNVLAAERLLKPVSGKRPVGFKPERNNIPTLKELAWAAKSANENFETVKTMNNKQLKLLSKVGPINWTLLKPKPRPTANNIARQRNTAARKIQGAAKKYLRRKAASQRVQGPSPRSPGTLARQANLGIMAGARRSPGAANNTRVTWSRNANGKISIHKTLRNLNLSMPQAMRNILENMPQNRAMNVIRQMARQR